MTNQTTITAVCSKRVQIEAVRQPNAKTKFRAIILNVSNRGGEEVLDIFESESLKWVTTIAAIHIASHMEVSIDDINEYSKG